MNNQETRPLLSECLCGSRASEMSYPQTELQSEPRVLVNVRALRILLRLRILGILGKVKRLAKLSARFFEGESPIQSDRGQFLANHGEVPELERSVGGA
jgi:hypothetical protein